VDDEASASEETANGDANSADFINGIGHEQTSRHVRVMSVIPLIVLQNSIDGGGEA
jgi:hypothetical protein